MAREEGIYFGRNILREALAVKALISEIYYDTDAARKFVESLSGVKAQKIVLKAGLPAAFKHQAHQGIVFKTTHSFYKPFSTAMLRQFPFVILCNQIEDIHNFGSIARCAAGFGAKLIIHEEKNSAELTPAAVKSSAGLAFRLTFVKVPSLLPVAKELAAQNFSVVGLDASKSAVSLFDWIPSFPLALILGSEGSGISAPLKSRCETLVRIPMQSSVESLNVSHAAAIAMNWAYKTESRFR